MTHRLLREPLVHFLLLGVALFALDALLPGRGGAAPESVRIVVTKGRVAQLRDSFAAKSGKPPTPEELDGLVATHVREETLYREATRLGLDRDDSVVRARLIEKLQFLQADIAGAAPPTDADLQRTLDAQADRFRTSAGGKPNLAEVREAVEAAWRFERRKAADDATYERLRKRYEVVIETDATK